MKVVILLALVAFAAAQNHHGHRPGFDHGDPLHQLIYAEVQQIVSDNQGISVSDCSTKCDALFDLNAGHDEENTDRLCQEECNHQLNNQGQTHTHPTHPPHPAV